MPDDEPTYYREKLHQVYEVPKHDELVQGAVTRDYVLVNPGSKEIERGMLLMLSGNNFVPATSSEVTSAGELCICARDYANGSIEGEDGSLLRVWAYFSGTFKGSSIVLPYEGEDDDHDELIEAIIPTLRKQKIFIVE